MPLATAITQTSSTSSSDASTSPTALVSTGGQAIGRRSPQVDGASTQIYPQTDDPIVLQNMGMQDPAVAQAYAMGMKIGKHHCSLPATVSNVSTHRPETKGALPPGVVKLGSYLNSEIRPAEKQYANPTAVAKMEERMDDDTSSNFWEHPSRHEQKRDFESDNEADLQFMATHPATGTIPPDMDKSVDQRAPKTTDVKMTEAVSDDASRHFGGKHEQKRDIWSTIAHMMTGQRDAGMNKSVGKRASKVSNAQMTRAVSDDAPSYPSSEHEQKRDIWSTIGHWLLRDPEDPSDRKRALQVTQLNTAKRDSCDYITEWLYRGTADGREKYCSNPPRKQKKRAGSPDIPGAKVYQGSDTNLEEKGHHPQSSAAPSTRPPRSLPWVYLLLLGVSIFVSLFSTCTAAEPAPNLQLQTTGVEERAHAQIICLEYGIRTHGHVNGGPRLIGGHCYPWKGGKKKRSDPLATVDAEPEPDLLAGADDKEASDVEIIDIDVPLEPKKSTIYCPGGTSTTCSLSAAKRFRPLLSTYLLLLTSLLLTTHLIPYAAPPTENPPTTQPPASPPQKRHSHAKLTRPLHLATLLLFTLLFSTARALPVDEMHHSLAPQPILTSILPPPTLVPRADEMRLSLMSALAAAQTIMPRAPFPISTALAHSHTKRETSPTAQMAAVGGILGLVGLTVVALVGVCVMNCRKRRGGV